MANLLLLILFLVALMRLESVTSISPEAYWNLKLPYTPMPKSLHQALFDGPLTPVGKGKPTDRFWLSYRKRILVSSNPIKQGLESTHGSYAALLANNKQGLESTEGGYGALLTYYKQGSESANNGNGALLANNKQGLESTNGGYGALLSYYKQGSESASGGDGALLANNKQGLESTNGGYGALLSYYKQGSESANGGDGALLVNNKQGLESTNGGYGALLSYYKQGSESTNVGDDALLANNKQGLESTNGGYGALLSYYKQGSEPANAGNGAMLADNKQGLESTNGGYNALSSYDKQRLFTTNSDNGALLADNKQGLESTNGGYGALLTYFKQGLESTNGGYGAFKQGFESTNEKQHDHAKKSSQFDDENSDAREQFFFIEKDLLIGSKMTIHFQKSTRKSTFLPREVSNQIPFSSDKVEETLRILSLDPKSKEAYVLSKRIDLCEEPSIEAVEKQCVTSLESMVDYVISKIGSNVKVFSTQIDQESKIEFTIKGVEKLVKDDHETVVCHKLGYPYAVFFCHRTKTIRSYMVSLLGEDGTKIEAVVACHKESNDFLDNYATNVLKIVPGSTHICHFPPAEDTVIWVPSE